MPGALAIVLVGYAEALGGAKAAAVQGGGDIDPNQELIAHGSANILSGLFPASHLAPHATRRQCPDLGQQSKSTEASAATRSS